MAHLDNSESSAAEDGVDLLTAEERNVRIFAKQMLQGRLFLGHFQERRFVEPLQAYRDVIIINDEDKFKNDIELVRKRLKNFYRNNWIGITNPTFVGAPNGYCFWVESNSNTFGHYWYKIKSLRFRRKEILLRLKVVRPMTDMDNEVHSHMTNDIDSKSVDVLLENLKNACKENMIWLFTEAVTVQNIKQTVTFLSVLIVTLLTSLIYGIKYLMEFVLKLLREISVFIHAATPFLIACVNLVGKIVGGFYLLIAMIWRGSSRPFVQPQRSIAYYQNPGLRAIEMPPHRPRSRPTTNQYREPLTITEIE